MQVLFFAWVVPINLHIFFRSRINVMPLLARRSQQVTDITCRRVSKLDAGTSFQNEHATPEPARISCNCGHNSDGIW